MSISPYKAMWLIAMFDLPVETPENRKEYVHFRRTLLKDGFVMLQFSVYARFCSSEDAAKVHRKRLRAVVPQKGQVRILGLTDAQFGKMEVFSGKKEKKAESAPAQLTFF